MSISEKTYFNKINSELNEISTILENSCETVALTIQNCNNERNYIFLTDKNGFKTELYLSSVFVQTVLELLKGSYFITINENAPTATKTSIISGGITEIAPENSSWENLPGAPENFAFREYISTIYYINGDGTITL